MSISVSMKGVTHLLEGRYKQRHQGSRDTLQQPTTGFITKKQYYKSFPEELQVKRKQIKKKVDNILQSDNQAQAVKVPRLKAYTIDKKQVTHRILNYVNQMKGEKLLYMWTVTFHAGTQDAIAYKLLNKWLTRLRKESMIKEYLWIAERQKGDRLKDKSKKPTNTLHFHIAINNRMDVKRANRYMRASIMTCIDDGEINYSREHAKNYNGVDIAKNKTTHRVTNFAKQKNQKALSNYLAKYVSKSSDTFQHLAWHNSRGYSNLIISVALTPEEFFSSTLKELVDIDKPLEGQYFIFFRWKGEPPKSLLNYLAGCNQKIMELINIPGK